ncbi:MAG: 50S ribosomal protein L32 [bacterium]
MSQVVKRKTSKSRTARRRSHLVREFKNTVTIAKCQSCGTYKKPHRVCPFCGKYDNKIII